jgi:hypothetical protein
MRQHLMLSSPTASAPSASKNLTEQVFAFGLEGSIPRLKIYMMPDAKVRQSPPEKWISCRDYLITTALEGTGLGVPWSLVRSYLLTSTLAHQSMQGT